MAAAIAASAMATMGIPIQAQTTGGGIGAAVNGNAGAAGGVQTPGTSGGSLGTGAAAPNAPANPLRPGTGPGINNTGSPALPLPRNLQTPVGGTPGRANNGNARTPGQTAPTPRPLNRLNGANVPQPISPPADGTPVTDMPTPRLPGNNRPNTTGGVNNNAGGNQNRAGANSGTATNRPGANLRTGTITNFTDGNISFREGANTSTLNITPDTVVQMDGRNITLRDIPANSQVSVERSPTNANQVRRIVVQPQGAANANGPTSVNMQTGTGSTGSANRSLRNDVNAGTNNGSVPGNDINAGTANGSTPGNDINAGTGNATTPGNDINAGTANGSTPGNDVNAPVVNNPNTSNRPLAPGQNPADRPVAPFTRGADGRQQAGFTEPNNNNLPGTGTQQNATGTNGPMITPGQSPSTVNQAPSPDTGKNAPVVLPNTGGIAPVGGDPSPGNGRPPLELRNSLNTFNNRFGAQLNGGRDGLTVGNFTGQSFAAQAGLQQGDRIQAVNGTNVSSPADFARTLQTANQSQTPINARVFRDGASRDVSLSLPNGFFDGLSFPAAASGAGVVPSVGAGGAAVAADGTVGVNAGGVFVPTEGDVTSGVPQGTGTGATAGAAAASTTGQSVGQSVAQQQPPLRNRPVDPPVGTQRTGVTTEALKVPDVDLGWSLKATPEGVVMSSLVDDGLAAKNKLQSGDVIEAIDNRPVNSPGAVSYELHRHRAGATVDLSIMRNGRRVKEQITLPESHKPLLLNRNETFGQANNSAKEQGASGARPLEVKPTEESIRTLEAENKALRSELEELRGKKP